MDRVYQEELEILYSILPSLLHNSQNSHQERSGKVLYLTVCKRFATFVLFKAQDFYWPKIYFTKFKKRAFSCFFLKKAVFRCSFWFLAVFVFVTIVLVCLSSA